MTHDLRFQVLVMPTGSWSEHLGRFRHVEELGFDVVATADLLVDWIAPRQPMFEGWTSLAAVAAATSKIRLTTLVTQIGLRNPALLAHMAVTLDHISRGRLEVGLGTGLVEDPSLAMAGIGSWTARERVDRFGEYVEVLDRAMTSETASFDGRYYQLNEYVTSPLPVQRPRPPLLVAALGPRMMRHAARHADIWNTMSFRPQFEEQLAEVRSRIAQMRTLCDAIDRDPAEIRISVTWFDREAREGAGMFSYYRSEEEFRARVAALHDAGVSEMSIYYPLDDGQIPLFEHLAESVIPELRAE